MKLLLHLFHLLKLIVPQRNQQYFETLAAFSSIVAANFIIDALTGVAFYRHLFTTLYHAHQFETTVSFVRLQYLAKLASCHLQLQVTDCTSTSNLIHRLTVSVLYQIESLSTSFSQFSV
ncbi:hypothetical protein CW304_03280 [Bacillus sp. UFRGS-B20]|nr:hypothetical protein CW304_03280 [Bacillus sp. UFRGS-B20]